MTHGTCEVMCNDSCTEPSLSFIGLPLVSTAKTATILKRHALLEYPIHLVFLNFMSTFSPYVIYNVYTLVVCLPVDNKTVKTAGDGDDAPTAPMSKVTLPSILNHL